MEQAALECQADHDGLETLAQRARREYLRSVEALQAEFIRLAANEGWPASGPTIHRNNQLFNRIVAQALDQGENVAYFLVDSLRFELGAELEKQLADKQSCTLHTVCAQLPTYTEVGMASLMPDAETALGMVEKDGKLVTTLNHNPATGPASWRSCCARRSSSCRARCGCCWSVPATSTPLPTAVPPRPCE
jgi:hypothetical protein